MNNAKSSIAVDPRPAVQHEDSPKSYRSEKRRLCGAQRLDSWLARLEAPSIQGGVVRRASNATSSSEIYRSPLTEEDEEEEEAKKKPLHPFHIFTVGPIGSAAGGHPDAYCSGATECIVWGSPEPEEQEESLVNRPESFEGLELAQQPSHCVAGYARNTAMTPNNKPSYVSPPAPADAHVWVKHAKLGFVPAVVMSSDPAAEWRKHNNITSESRGNNCTSESRLVVAVLGSGEIVEAELSNGAAPVHPSCLRGVADLLSLGEFDLGPLLHNIRVRYYRNEIYTAVGPPILISVNPYKPIPNLYSLRTAEQYRRQVARPIASFQEELATAEAAYYRGKAAHSTPVMLLLPSQDDATKTPGPHPFLIAQLALSSILAGAPDQSIIISGESGAGKTEATKIILSYLAGNNVERVTGLRVLSGQHEESSPQAVSPLQKAASPRQQEACTPVISLETQITESNPILESFGNAKTLRNDNSSRFGKFTQVVFELRTQKLMGARVSNYLLEKSRIVKQQPGERNYHIFYQLCCGRSMLDAELQDTLALGPPGYFHYLRTCTEEIAGSDDAEDFREIIQCLRGLKFIESQITEMWKVIAGILHLGNVTFDWRESDDAIEITNASSFTHCCRLFGVTGPQLEALLKTRRIPDVMSGSLIETPRRLAEVLFTRDALCKAIYERLFQWLVQCLNSVLAAAFDRGENAAKGLKKPQSGAIGLLDIFGFEIFEVNSFEQLCINFANEQLQQHFNNHVFREEQALYIEEGIDWSTIKFEDNQRIIDALTDRITGVFPTLDSECLMPKASDSTFLRKVTIASEKCNAIVRPSSLQQDHQFGIAHYAGTVFYDVNGMLEKNRDHVHQDVYDSFSASATPFLQELFCSPAVTMRGRFAMHPLGAKRLPASFINATVSYTFREQLAELMAVLDVTTASYIRCIKPNGRKAAMDFDSLDVLRQLKCAGMLESIRIRKAGYAVRLDLRLFVSRYRVLLSRAEARAFGRGLLSPRAAAVAILRRVGGGEDLSSWQVGRAMVFLKDSFQTHMERRAAAAWACAATQIQSQWRRLQVRRWYGGILAAAALLQERCRVVLASSAFLAFEAARHSAAERVQATWKGRKLQAEWLRLLTAARRICRWWKREMQARRQIAAQRQIITAQRIAVQGVAVQGIAFELGEAQTDAAPIFSADAPPIFSAPIASAPTFSPVSSPVKQPETTTASNSQVTSIGQSINQSVGRVQLDETSCDRSYQALLDESLYNLGAAWREKEELVDGMKALLERVDTLHEERDALQWRGVFYVKEVYARQEALNESNSSLQETSRKLLLLREINAAHEAKLRKYAELNEHLIANKDEKLENQEKLIWELLRKNSQVADNNYLLEEELQRCQKHSRKREEALQQELKAALKGQVHMKKELQTREKLIEELQRRPQLTDDDDDDEIAKKHCYQEQEAELADARQIESRIKAAAVIVDLLKNLQHGDNACNNFLAVRQLQKALELLDPDIRFSESLDKPEEEEEESSCNGEDEQASSSFQPSASEFSFRSLPQWSCNQQKQPQSPELYCYEGTCASFDHDRNDFQGEGAASRHHTRALARRRVSREGHFRERAEQSEEHCEHTPQLSPREYLNRESTANREPPTSGKSAPDRRRRLSEPRSSEAKEQPSPAGEYSARHCHDSPRWTGQ